VTAEPLFSHPAFAAGTTLTAVADAASGCTLCPLAETRTQVVFGVGSPTAQLMFVGEGPGQQEDLQGEPFVGRAGKLLTQLIEGIGLTRADVYIANVVKCRPPGNRDPLPVEIEACSPWLDRQLELIVPAVVVTLGNFATKLLLDTKLGITRLRGEEFPFERAGVKAVLVPTLHPAAVLRGGGKPLAETRADFVRVKWLLNRSASAGRG
jgi:DNA polymerase